MDACVNAFMPMREFDPLDGGITSLAAAHQLGERLWLVVGSSFFFFEIILVSTVRGMEPL